MTTTFRRPPPLQRVETHRFSGPMISQAPAVMIRRAARYLPPVDIDPFAHLQAPDPNPYVDYGRFLTAEGGILFRYKDLDERLRHTLWRLFAWTAATGLEGWFLFANPLVHSTVLKIAALALLALFNWLIVRKPVELYRRLELRTDCMIVEGTDVFWRRMMEVDVPRFKPNEEGHQVLGGIYGTRFVEYLTVRKFDEFDRTPEVFASNLEAAMHQVWTNAPYL